MRRWKEHEEQLLKDYYFSVGAKGLVKQLDRSLAAIQDRARRLGLKYKGYNKWSKQEDKILVDNFRFCYKDDIIRLIGRDWRSIKHRAERF